MLLFVLRQGLDRGRTGAGLAGGGGTACAVPGCSTAGRSAPSSAFLTVSGRDWRAGWVCRRARGGNPVAWACPKPRRIAALPVFTSPNSSDGQHMPPLLLVLLAALAAAAGQPLQPGQVYRVVESGSITFVAPSVALEAREALDIVSTPTLEACAAACRQLVDCTEFEYCAVPVRRRGRGGAAGPARRCPSLAALRGILHTRTKPIRCHPFLRNSRWVGGTCGY